MALVCLQQLQMLAGMHDAMLTYLQLPSSGVLSRPQLC